MTSPLFQPGQIWRDTGGEAINAHGGGILFHDGVYWWFGEHKTAGDEGNYAHVGVHVYSSRDLLAWTDEGIALAVDPASEIVPGCIIERPKVLFNPATGKFVMWFHFEPAGHGYTAANGSRSGVALADHPAGPYRFLGTQRPNAGVWPQNAPPEHCRPLTLDERAALDRIELFGGPVPYYPKHTLFRRDFAVGQMARDMTLFVDDDGTAYHLYSSEGNGTLHISQLSDDYLTHAGKYIRVLPGRFNEAPSLMKWRGKYFLFTSDCTGWAPNPARLLRADSIWGPWEELGNPCLGPGHLITNTFESQVTFILPVQGREDAFIFMADRWRPANAIDGRYVWLPIRFRHDVPVVEWRDAWDPGYFDVASSRSG